MMDMTMFPPPSMYDDNWAIWYVSYNYQVSM